jgi:type I restriction enzyme S subunit
MSATKNRIFITSENSYYVSHLAAIIPSPKYDSSYLARFLSWYNPTNLILDNAYPSIRLEDINNLEIPLPPLATQQKIAAILDQADAIIQNNRNIVQKYDALTQSLFLDMFGDPVKNEKGWEKFEFKKFGKISTGNTPSRSVEENYNVDFIEWIKTDNIKEHEFYISQAQEYLSEKGATKGRIVSKNSLLVTCIAGSLQSIGRAAVTSHTVAFNQQINAIEPNENVNISFLYYLVKKSRKYFQDHASTGMKRMLTKGEFEKIKMILPPIQLQNQFSERVQAIEAQKQQAQLELAKSESLFNSLLQGAFKGELE